MASGAEAGGSAGSFGEGVGLFEGGLKALDEAELGDAVTGSDEVGLSCEIGKDDLEFAAVSGINDAGKGSNAAQGEAAAVFNEGTVGGGKFEGEAGADGLCGAGVADGGEGNGLGGKEVGGEIAKGTDVGVAGKLGGGQEPLHLHDGTNGGREISGHRHSHEIEMFAETFSV